MRKRKKGNDPHLRREAHSCNIADINGTDFLPDSYVRFGRGLTMLWTLFVVDHGSGGSEDSQKNGGEGGKAKSGWICENTLPGKTRPYREKTGQVWPNTCINLGPQRWGKSHDT